MLRWNATFIHVISVFSLASKRWQCFLSNRFRCQRFLSNLFPTLQWNVAFIIFIRVFLLPRKDGNGFLLIFSPSLGRIDALIDVFVVFFVLSQKDGKGFLLICFRRFNGMSLSSSCIIFQVKAKTKTYSVYIGVYILMLITV